MEQLTAVEEGGRGDWMKEGEGSAKEHICITHRHRQQCDDGLREGRVEGWVEVSKRGENGTTVME